VPLGYGVIQDRVSALIARLEAGRVKTTHRRSIWICVNTC
jgi:hypothetical protein